MWWIVAIVLLLMVVFGVWQSHGGVGKGNDRGISATLRDAADAEATAARSLDESALEAVYGGSALERMRQVIETLRESGVYADAVLKTEDIERIHFSNDGERATAVVTETWQLTMYSVSGGALVRGPIAQTDRQRVTFVRDGNHWLIDDLTDQGLSHG